MQLTQRTDTLTSTLRTPIVAAPMFLVSGPDLVVAACRAGAMGAFPAPNCRTAEQLDEWLTTITSSLDEIRALGETPAPWALNLITHSSNARLAEDLTLVAKHQPPVVITALGSPAPVSPVAARGARRMTPSIGATSARPMLITVRTVGI